LPKKRKIPTKDKKEEKKTKKPVTEKPKKTPVKKTTSPKKTPAKKTPIKKIEKTEKKKEPKKLSSKKKVSPKRKIEIKEEKKEPEIKTGKKTGKKEEKKVKEETTVKTAEVKKEVILPKKIEEPETHKKIRSEINKILKDRFLPRSIVDRIITMVSGDKKLESKLKDVVSRALEEYERNFIDPSEACGIVGAQSIGEPGTQMSLPYDEKILLKQDREIRVSEIGKFVDKLMHEFGYKNIGESDVLNLLSDVKIFVPSLNENENIEWKKIISCSRHKSPGRLIKIRTRSGREICATDAHSFVIRNENKIVPISGKKLRIGERIPVIKKLPENCISVLDLSSFLNIGEIDYAFEKEGFVYPYPSRKRLPRKMELNGLFGWFMGAYLAEGNSTKYYTSISNINEEFLSRVREFAEKYDLTYNEYDNYRGFAVGHDIRVNSSLLSYFIKKACGSGAYKKKIPDFAYSTSEGFICGLLKGYFDGDGNVSVERKVIRISSASEELIDGIALLLNRIGIFSSKSKGKECSLSISYRYAPLFLEKIGLDIKDKREKLGKLRSFNSSDSKSYDVLDMVPNFGRIFYEIADKIGFPKRMVRNFTRRQRIGRITLSRYINRFEKIADEKNVDIEKEIKTLRKMLNGDVVWDEIRDISYIDAKSDYVYDLSVEGLETFTTFDGVITHNTMRTFHYAGVAEINVTLGLPRLIEIVDARSTPSTPMMNIYLRDEYRLNSDLAKEVANQIEITRLNDVADIETDLTNLVIYINPDEKTMKKKGFTVDELLESVKKIRGVDAKIDKRKIKVSFDDPSYKSLLDVNESLKKLKVKGIDGIKRIIIRREPNEGYVIYSEGSNLEKVLEIEGVDPHRTTTNDIQAVGRVLGIEAARNMIIQEAYSTLMEQGLNVDKRHIMLVADVMTTDGSIRAIGRHGVSAEKESVLSRAAFEITVSHLLQASRRGETDRLGGVAENIIVGQPVNLGTGAVELVMQRRSKKKVK